MRRFALLFLVLTFGVVTQPAAQESRGRGMLTGFVLDNATEAALPGVRVDLLDERDRVLARTVTDAEGRFYFDETRSGAFLLRAGRIGYRTVVTPRWQVAAGEILQLEIRLEEDAVLLAPLTVVAAGRVRPSPVLEGFRDRVASGLGVFITRADIERHPRLQVTDLIATLPGVRLESSGSGPRRTVYMNRARPGRDCPAQIYVDGMLLNRRLPRGGDAGFALDDAVHPSAVEGIEVYRGLAGVPAEFLSPEAPCGVVVIWTRRSDRSG